MGQIVNTATPVLPTSTPTQVPTAMPTIGVKVDYSPSIKLGGGGGGENNCTTNPDFGSTEISIIDYINNLSNKTWEVFNNETYSYIEGEKIVRNGPFTTWYFEMFLEDVASHRPEKFETISIGSSTKYLWKDYVEYLSTVCDAYHDRTTLRSALLAHAKFIHWNTNWSGHASKWKPFQYI